MDNKLLNIIPINKVFLDRFTTNFHFSTDHEDCEVAKWVLLEGSCKTSQLS